MPLKSYGVLVARAIASHKEGPEDETPHFQVHLVDDNAVNYRAAVNVKSQLAPSELLYLAIENFDHPITAELEGLGSGWHDLSAGRVGPNLDYIRGNLFDREYMRVMPLDLPDVDNDLAGSLDHHITRAIYDEAARVYVFGEPWGPEPDKPDKVFGFTPGNGVHDVHMNQGNHPRFRRDDGVWQDGAILVWYPRYGQWVAIFLAFQSQAWHTDDETGHAIPAVVLPGQTEPVLTDQRVRIVGALVNPIGPDLDKETVTLLNASPNPVELAGWSIADRDKNAMTLPEQTLAPGEATRVALRQPVQLGNRGGLISVLEPGGAKVDGVAYTGRDAAIEGWTVTFGSARARE